MCRGVHRAGDSHWFQNDEVIIKLMKERGGSQSQGGGETVNPRTGQSSGHSGGPSWLGRRRVGMRAMGR